MRRLTLFIVVLANLGSPSVSWGQDPFQNGAIVVETTYGTCYGSFPIYYPTTLHVVYYLGSANQVGLTGAGFQIRGFPADWLIQATPHPAADVVLGDPFSEGVVLTFPSCQDGQTSGQRLLLYTLQVVPLTSTVVPFIVETRATSQSGYPHDNPFVTLCDEPQFTVREVACGAFFGNYGWCPCCTDLASTSLCATVAVEATTWSQTKALFR
jgi:hypothetical protein